MAKGEIYGYARVSTPKQSIDRQIRNIKAGYPDAVIITDKYTGLRLDRPGWVKLYKRVKAGDSIVFDSVSRMSRNAEEGFLIYEELYNRGVELVFLKERHIDTETYKKAIEGQIQLTINSGNAPADEFIARISDAINGYLLALAKEQIRLAFEQAEKEVQDLHQRTKEGIRERKRKNERIALGLEEGTIKPVGQRAGAKLVTKKSIAAKEDILKYSKDFNGTLPDSKCIQMVGVNRNTFYKYKRELKEELAGGE